MQDQPELDLDLDEIEARSSIATKGPWEFIPPGSLVGHSLRAVVKTNWELIDWICQFQLSNRPNWYNDGVFIAHARADVPALIAEGRKLRRENGQLIGELAVEQTNRQRYQE